MKSNANVLVRASWFAVVGNALLSLIKIVAGVAGGSMAVIGDGIDSATDVVTSLITLYTAHIIRRPPDRNYAYGYDKADQLASKVLSMVILFAGLQMLFVTAKGIIFYQPRQMPSAVVIYATVASMLGKLALAWHQFYCGKKTGSSMLKANARNMRNDVIISAGVLLGLGFTFVLKMPILDFITGLLISLYIIKSAIQIFMESNVALMDGVRDTSVYQKIFTAVEQTPGASNPHRVRSRQIGHFYMIVLDVEADGHITLNEAHDIAQRVEQNIHRLVDNVYDIVVHVEPKGVHHSSEKFGWNPSMVE